MTVLPFSRTADALAAAIARHPSSHTPPVPLLHVDRAHALRVFVREWDHIADRLSAGPDSVTPDEAQELLIHLTSALVHPDAIKSLPFLLAAYRGAVARWDRVRDGDIDPWTEYQVSTVAEALVEAEADLDLNLYPLLHGLPARDACRRCRATIARVEDWQTQVGCALHGRAL